MVCEEASHNRFASLSLPSQPPTNIENTLGYAPPLHARAFRRSTTIAFCHRFCISLSDAIALDLRDGFYTSSFLPSTLTAWRYQDIKREANNGGLGGAFPKLLTRHLPRHYTFVSLWYSDCHYMQLSPLY